MTSVSCVVDQCEYATMLPSEIAEHIASTESRVEHLRASIERLREEGSDADDTEASLNSLTATLRQLYARQSQHRRGSRVIWR